jgi:Tfp pilus assembly protein PilX
MSSQTRKSERGIALIIVLFSLLLLSVIGLGMMYSTNMVTSINYNYRDKQVAFYAALAGLQEARDRIQPSTHNIVAPTALPSTSAPYIIYILSNAATVNPWVNTNTYFDTELCQDQVLNLTRNLGVPCVGPYPAGPPLWYSYVDDSLLRRHGI